MERKLICDILFRRTDPNFVHDYIRYFSVDLEKQCSPDNFLKDAFQPENRGYRGFIDFREAYTYTPGETVYGKIRLELNKASPVFKLDLKIKGVICVLSGGWHSTESDWKEEIIFENTTIFIDHESGKEPVLSHGEHMFDFKCDLPNDTVGCLAYAGKDGQEAYVVFYAETSIYFSDHIEPIKSECFIPVQRRFWITDPKLEFHMNKENTDKKQAKFMLGFSGTLDVQLSLKQGFFITSGHDLLVDIHIDNKSRHVVDQLSCSFYQVVRFFVRSSEVLKVQRKLALLQIPVKIDHGQEEDLCDVRIHTDPTLEPAISKSISKEAALHVVLGYAVVAEVGISSQPSSKVHVQVPVLLCSPTQSDLGDWETARALHRRKDGAVDGNTEVMRYEFKPDSDYALWKVKTATDILMEPYVGALVLAQMKLKELDVSSEASD